MDTTIDLKKKIKDYLENADERILKIIHAIIETETKKEELPQTQKDLLDQRLQFHKKNPSDGRSWESIKKSLESQHGL